MQSLSAAALVAILMLATASGPAGSTDIDAPQAALNREADRAVAENDRAFREGEEVGRRYGVDLTAHRDARDGLHRKRQDALRQGNYLRARMFEALLASNTGNLLEAVLPHLPPGPERQRYGQRMQEARASADAFKASLAPSGR